MKLTRTQLALILLITTVVLGMVDTVIPGPSGVVVDGRISTHFIAIMCIGWTVFLLELGGLVMLLSDARRYGTKHRAACVAALALYVVAFAIIGIGAVSRVSFSQTGDVLLYRQVMYITGFAAGVRACALALVTWSLYKPELRLLPVMIGTLQIVAGAGNIAVSGMYTTLVERTVGGQSVYVPRYLVPPFQGLLLYLYIGTLVGELLLGGSWVLLLLAPGFAMRASPGAVENQEELSDSSPSTM